MVATADLGHRDTVIEVGSGAGILTRRLADVAGKLVTVEVDPRFARALHTAIGYRAHVKVVRGDILTLAPATLLQEVGRCEELCGSYKVVANLPYYITSPVLRHFLWSDCKPSLMVVMVQKEVGEAIAATRGKRSLLTLMVQMFSAARVVRYVGANCFRPRPKVDSVILRLDVHPEPAVRVDDVEGLFALIKDGFRSPRKQLRNSLAAGLGLHANETTALLVDAGIDYRRRPETLSLEEWARLWKLWRSRGDAHRVTGEGPGQDQSGPRGTGQT